MSRNAPTAGAILTIVGGVFIFLGGLLEAALGAILSVFGVISWFFYIGLFVGLITIILGVLALVRPQMKVAWGAIIIVMAIVSLPTAALGGFVIGFILALIGGILVLVFKPPMMVAVAYPGQPMPGAPMPGQPVGAPMPMNCPACGGAINPATRTCTACGRAV